MDAGVILADKYQLGEPIGRGAMGTVYRAVQLALGREVAVKVLHGELIGQPGAHARFVREAKVAAQLRHPASVQVIDFGEHDGAPYLVMELLAGRSLRAALDDGVPAQPMALTAATSRPRWPRPTTSAWSTATSSRRTSCSPATVPTGASGPAWSTSGWPSSTRGRPTWAA
ncbi:MAG: protein kinase [Kofleriaceae bacterium]|nr:protein kinase [Kofleriaceae bacterium]